MFSCSLKYNVMLSHSEYFLSNTPMETQSRKFHLKTHYGQGTKQRFLFASLCALGHTPVRQKMVSVPSPQSLWLNVYVDVPPSTHINMLICFQDKSFSPF